MTYENAESAAMAGVLDSVPGPCGGVECASARCPNEGTFWHPYIQVCIVMGTVQENYDPVCGCDGATYQNPNTAALAGNFETAVGFCGEILTECGDRSCASQELCRLDWEAENCSLSGSECRPAPSECSAPMLGTEVCGCGGEWYEDVCHLELAGASYSPSQLECGQPPGSKRVFISRAQYRGNWGGAVIADQDCQQEAQAAGVGGNWRAFIEDESRSIDTILSNAPVFVDMDNKRLFESKAHFLALDINNDYLYGDPATHADGEEWLEFNPYFWLGFDKQGIVLTCQNWTSGSMEGIAARFRKWGNFDRLTTIDTIETSCDDFPTKPFLCVEQ